MYWMIGGVATVLGAALVVLCIQNFTVPELGVENGQFKPLAAKPNGVSTQAKDEAKRVAPIPFKASHDSIIPVLKSLIASMPGATVKQVSDNYVYAVFSSKTIGYRDDVELFVDESNSLIHFRSASRAGYSDLGVNRKRYQSFVKLVNQGALVKN